MKACPYNLFWTNEKEHETCNLEVELNSVLWNTFFFVECTMEYFIHLKQTLYLVNFEDPIYKSLENHDPSIHENYDVYLLVVYSSF